MTAPTPFASAAGSTTEPAVIACRKCGEPVLDLTDEERADRLAHYHGHDGGCFKAMKAQRDALLARAQAADEEMDAICTLLAPTMPPALSCRPRDQVQRLIAERDAAVERAQAAEAARDAFAANLPEPVSEIVGLLSDNNHELRDRINSQQKTIADLLRIRDELCAERDAARAALVIDSQILDSVQDIISIMNSSGEIADDVYEKFYEVIPHARWEVWLRNKIAAAQPTTEEPNAS